MITKKELKREIGKLLDICLEQSALLEIYKASAEESGNTIKELRRELKKAKRNEPIFTSDKYELKELREKVLKAEEEAAYYKALSETYQESNEELKTEINSLVTEKARKSDKQKSKANNG